MKKQLDKMKTAIKDFEILLKKEMVWTLTTFVTGAMVVLYAVIF